MPFADRDRHRTASDPEGAPAARSDGRAYSTTVELASEGKGGFFFRERSIRREKGRSELEMHAAIKQLRKIK